MANMRASRRASSTTNALENASTKEVYEPGVRHRASMQRRFDGGKEACAAAYMSAGRD